MSKFKTTTDAGKFDNSSHAAGVIYYPTIKQLSTGNRVVSIYSLLGEHRPSYSIGVEIFDAKTGKNSVSLGYFTDEASAIVRIKRHFAQNEEPDTYEFTCHGKTCCTGTPIALHAFTIYDAKSKAGGHWWGKDDFVFIQEGIQK